MTDYVVAGTGSRSIQTADTSTKRQAKDRLWAEVSRARQAHGYNLVLMSGLAEGWDHLICLAAFEFDVRLWCAIPNRRYGAYYWGHHSLTGQDRLPEFRSIRDRAWQVTHVMEDAHRIMGPLYLNGVHANFVRNDWMVTGHGEFTGADEFLVWDPASKGTAHCLAAIRRAGKPYQILSDQPAQLPLRSTH